MPSIIDKNLRFLCTGCPVFTESNFTGRFFQSKYKISGKHSSISLNFRPPVYDLKKIIILSLNLKI